MDNHWFENIDKRKRHTLHSLGAGFVFFVILLVLTKFFSVSLCPIKNILNIPCFGCGMTRGFLEILRLDFKMAYEYNVLSIPLFFGIAVYCTLTVIDIFFNNDFILKIEKQLSKKYMFLIYAVILIVASILNNQ